METPRKPLNKYWCSVPHYLSDIRNIYINKGNNKITELRAILQRKVKTHKYINRQNQSTTGKL